jgi:hypothetical protein
MGASRRQSNPIRPLVCRSVRVSPVTAFLPTNAATCTRRAVRPRAAAPTCFIIRQKRRREVLQTFRHSARNLK